MKKLIELFAVIRTFLGKWYPKVLSLISKSGTYKTVKGWSALAFVVLGFFLSREVLHWIEPTAGTYDAGVLQVIILTLVQMSVFQIVTWSMFKVLWPDLAYFLKNSFKVTFNELTSWQKICLPVFIYCFHFLMLVLLSRVFQ